MMPQTKEQHRECMRQWRAKHKKQVEPESKPIVEPEPTTEPEINIEVFQGKSDFKAKRKILIKFVRFDLFKPSNKEECLKVRLSKLGLFHEDKDRLEEHFELCEGCRDWFNSWKEGDENNPTLTSYDGLNVFLAYRADFPTEEDFWKKLKEINGKIVTIDKKLEKITVVVDSNEVNPNRIQQPPLDLTNLQLWNEPPKEKLPSTLSEDVKHQRELSQQEPTPESKPESPSSEQPTEQPKRKSNNPSWEEWSQSH